MKSNYCVECNNKCDYRAVRCRQCSNRIIPPHNKVHSLKTKNQISKQLLGNIPWNKGTAVIKKRISREELFQNRSKRMIGDNNPAKRKEVREKISNSLLNTYKNHPEILENRKPSGINQYTEGYTLIEKQVADTFKIINVPFIHNYKIGRYFADFLICNNVIVECDGTYWHKNKLKDNIRDKYLMDKGYYVFRISEERIKENVFQYTKGILEILRELGHKQAAGFQCRELPFRKVNAV